MNINKPVGNCHSICTWRSEIVRRPFLISTVETPRATASRKRLLFKNTACVAGVNGEGKRKRARRRKKGVWLDPIP